MLRTMRTAGWSAAWVAACMVLTSAPVEARALKTRQQDEAGSPSDQVRSARAGSVQKGMVQAPIQKGSPVQKGECCHRIRYHHHCSLRKTCCCSCGTIKTTLYVNDPGCCGTIAIPVCLPDCCDDAPKSDGHCGALGRGVTTFHWCCGYKVKVVVDRCGDVVVHSYGR